MEDPGAHHGDPRKPTAAPEAPSSGFPSPRTDGARSYVTSPFASFHASCTATDVQACHIIHQLTQWNAFLFPARFKLQELAGTRSRLSVSSFSKSGLDLPDPSESESSQGERALHRLLTTHHCIVSFHATPPRSGSCETLLCDALRRNTSLKTLKLQLSGWAISNGLAEAIQCLTSLEEIECTVSTDCHANVFAALCALLRTSSSLTSLRMYGLFLTQQENAMLAALKGNSTLREFSMGGSLELESSVEAFTNYIRFATALKTLCIGAGNYERQQALLRGVLQNRTLSSLTLTEFICNEQSTRTVGRILRENEVLLVFSIISTNDSIRPDCHRDSDWVAALSENKTLEELTLPLTIWPPAIWANFFRTLTKSSNMKKVYITNVCAEYSPLSSICSALEECGAEEKVSFGNYLVISNADLIKCKAFSGIYLFRAATDNVRLEAIRQLPQCPHLTHLAMNVSRGELTMSLALADYVKSTPYLRKLQLSVGRGAELAENLPNEWWTVIVNSICTNASLKELLIWADSIEEEDFQGLADSVRHSQSVRTFFLVNWTAANTSAFVTRLSTGIAGNYTLRSVKLHGRLDAEATRSWLAIADTTRRNSGILARAMQITESRRLDRYVAGALERVSLHVALVEDLADLCHATKEATAASIRKRLRSIESMDAFMRLTGVVRERVVCHPRDDGLRQLDQLGEDCWGYIRRYLMVEDIRISAEQIAETGVQL